MSIDSASRVTRRFAAAALICAAVGIVAAQAPPQATAPLASLSYVAGELLVKFRPDASGVRRTQALHAQAVSVLRRFDMLDLDHVALPPGVTVAAAVAAFNANPDVLYVEPNYISGIAESTPPNDPYWLNDSLYGLQKIMARPAWLNFGSGDGSVVVAHLDTGMNYNHPDLAPNVWTNPGESGPTAQQGPAPNCTSRGLALDKSCNNLDDDANGYVDDVHGIDAFSHDSEPLDEHGHGTKTAGIVGAVGNNGIGVVGVNWNVKMIPCKIFGPDGEGPESAKLECLWYILYLKNHGVNIRVSTNSWGYGRDINTPPSPALVAAFDSLGNAGILNIAAAGNYAANVDVASPFDPAAFPSASIVSVAASDAQDNRASFSNYGPIAVDLAAPGVDIYTTTKEGGYDLFYGTSASTPFVAGAAALLFAQKPSLTVSAAKALLLSSVDHLGQWTNLVGSGGRLNIYGAALANAGDIPPTVSITSPSAGATILTGPIALSASASDADGSVSSVTFFANGTAVGTDTTSPFSASWTPASAGDYSLTAVATDNAGATTTSAAVSIHFGSGGGSGTAATFIRTDSATVGTWKTVYGAQGYSIANDAASLPSYAPMAMSGQASWTWVGTTTDVRALQRAGSSTRQAATYYGTTSFTIDVPITDGQSHQIALYCVDWDSLGRSEQFDVIDAQTTTVLDTRTLSGFSGGKYLVWNVSGHVAIKVTNKGPGNAAVSGVFFDVSAGAGSNAPPTVSLTAPAAGTITSPPSVTVTAAAADSDGSVASVVFLANANVIGTDTTSPFSITWSPLPGDYSLTAIAADNSGATTVSTPVAVHIVASTNSPPTTALTAPAGGSVFALGAAITVSANAADSDGLIASVAFQANGSSIGLDNNAPFSISWTPAAAGSYSLTAVATDNLGATTTSPAVAITVTPPNSPPSVSLTAPASGASFAQGAAITVSANASDSDGTVSSVAFFAGSTPIGSDSSSPFSISWTPAAAGSYSLTAVATDNLGATATSAASPITVTAGGTPSASFVQTDTATKGTWNGVYGIQGYSVAGSGASLPGYAQVTMNGQASWTWASSTTDVRALERPGGGNRLAALWYTYNTFTIDVPITDGASHQIALYCLDWDSVGRSQQFDIMDAQTSAVLDTRTISGFSGGQYLVWNVTGHVVIKVTNKGAGNAGVSGLFIDAVTGSQSNTPPTVSITSPGPGASLTSPPAIAINATASDADGTVASVAFYANNTLISTDTTSPYSVNWSPSTGNYSLTAVATDNSGATTISAAVAVSVASANSPPTVSVTAPANGASFASGAAITVSANASDSNGTVSSVAFFAGSTPIGSDSTSPFSISWTPGGPGSYSLTAVATDNLGATTTSAAVSITVTSPNSAPVVSLTAPANGASFASGAVITVSANASDSDGTVSTVTFFAGATPIGSDSTSPFSISWTPSAPGSYSLTAIAADNLGASTTSAPINITVTSPNIPPTVSVTAPTNGESVALGTAVTVSANASDPDGTLTGVAFYAGATQIGTDSSGPYSISWTPGSVGTYSLTAVATDNLGASTTSTAVTLTVTAGGANTAAFVRSDATTKGTWKTVFGNQGYTLAVGETTLPAYAQVTMAGQNPYTWTGSTTDVRALQHGLSSTRFAALWYTYTSLTMDVTITDGQSHQISMYFLDWDSIGRSEQVDVLDAQTSAVLDTRTISGFSGGQYLVWNVSGHVTIKVTNKGPGNAAVSGLFFDAVAGAPANTPPTVSVTAPANGASFASGAAITVSATASDSDGTVSQVQFFAGATPIGTDTTSPFSISWTPPAAGNYSLTAVATDNQGATTISAAVGITVTSPNTPPTVSLSAPANGASFASGAAITVSATASDSDGTVSQVQFFAGVTPIGTDTTSPFSISWTPPAAGNYSLTAVATDNLGATTTSAAVGITVTSPNTPPTVSLSAPANGASFASGAAITVSATASDSDGTVSQVQFFAGVTPIGTDTTSPFSISWTPPAAGNYSLTAVATDNQGATTTSAAVGITVTSPNTPPTVSLSAPANGTSFASGAAITVSATASDSDGTVSQVQFFAGATPIGTDTTSPFSISWTPPAAGNYSLTAVATDNLGATTTSAAVGITVTAPASTTATFLRSDLTTKGTWRNVFGVQGYSLAADTTSLPSYAQLTMTGQSSWTWAGSTTDTRALQKGLVSGRQASAWYGWTTFSFDLRITDGSSRQIAIYGVDWDGVGRAERVDILNADTQAVLDTRTLSGFSGGQYLVWTVSGHVTVRITNTGSGNAVVSGLFVD